ncbi:hypothetical protein K466DRAFT_43353 [Polyporus arcularius HHB13444]|uniref:F-box domain-containing protein n=1 Tax=Polyporus arcularius HHB13444 TaxID=1314778 RepID=A0A5C3PSH2_9APHY|nr:hypothetical protein K466DRAFT_43353 [Polyporus arcularius HHB13444]
MSTFPPELTDEIIAWIPVVCGGSWHEDVRQRYPTLLSCSLVCSAWLHASRHQLFEVLSIGTPERYDLLVSRVLHSEKMRMHLPSVRTVYLFIDPDTPAFHGKPFVLEFAGHLPNLTSMLFYLHGVEAFSSHPSSVVVMSRFSTVRTLKIQNCTFPSFGDLRRTLSSLPSLSSLVLGNLSWPDPAADLSPRLSHGASAVRRPALLHLNVTSDNDPPSRRRAQQFIAWLSETATTSSLLDLEVGIFNESTPGGQTGCMVTFGPSLFRLGRGVRKLKIAVGESRDTELELFLCTLTSLTSLHLRCYCVVKPDIWVQMERLVTSLPRPTQLIELSISVIYDGPPADFVGLESLDAALRPELLRALQAVKLDIWFSRKERAWSEVEESALAVTEPTVRDVMKNRLPKLSARNIIEVTAHAFEPWVPPRVDVEPESDPMAALS